ncbi:hypothetical protein C8Q79DRAFT_1010291 [Trametes meyenii]|nr:hypothetical protein C8Q79DRAFT_1010291 [Trametes meyenii]
MFLAPQAFISRRVLQSAVLARNVSFRLTGTLISRTFRTSSPQHDGASHSPRSGVGVAGMLQAPGSATSPTLFNRDFSLGDRVALLVSGGHGGIGLEAALALAEAGARAVYCVDLPTQTGP